MFPALACAVVVVSSPELWLDEQYEYVRLKCVSSEPSKPERKRLEALRDSMVGKDTRLANLIGEREIRPLTTFDVESNFQVVKIVAGHGRAPDELRGQFRSMMDEKPRDKPANVFAGGFGFVNKWPGMGRRIFSDPWLEPGDEGYYWVRRGALVGHTAPDEWGVVTDKPELARLTPFPDLCGAFGLEEKPLAVPRPTKRECEEWAVSLGVALSERDEDKRRKLLLRCISSDNEMLASWPVHRLTLMPADRSTAAAVRELLDDPALSPLVIVTCDRYLCDHQPDTWPASADRQDVMVKTLHRMRLTDRQVKQFSRFLNAELSHGVLMEVLLVALKMPEKEFVKRIALIKSVDALGVLNPQGPQSQHGPDSEEVVAAKAKFYETLLSDKYPPLVRMSAGVRLKDPLFKR